MVKQGEQEKNPSNRIWMS